VNRHKTILVAPLNWGLGHATRCIPIIKGLLSYSYKVYIASDGESLRLLRKEFPGLDYVELPSYDIRYPKKGKYFKAKLLVKLPGINKTAKRERKLVKALVEDGQIDGIISDNRLGVYHKDVPSAFITHQINVLSGSTSKMSSKLHQKIIRKFDRCFVPDVEGATNLSGKLGHPTKLRFKPHYLGLLSRMKKQALPVEYDIIALLSGPEPQRSMLEELLMEQLQDSDKRILLIQGRIEAEQTTTKKGAIEVVNFMTTKQLEYAINASGLIVARSGYTTLMDLAVLEKNAFFIPTPGQYEQEYLAKRLKEKGIAPFSKQKDFKVDMLNEVSLYKGLKGFGRHNDLNGLIGFLEGKGEF